MRHTYIFIFLILIGFNPSEIIAQESLQLTEKAYKQVVVETNYKILSANATVEAANSQIDVQQKDFLPSLDFVGSSRYYDERVTPEGLPTLRQNFMNVGLRLSQNIYSGGMVQKNKTLAEIYAQEAQAGKEITENDILYLASMTFWTAVSSAEELQIWKDYRNRFKDFHKTIEDRVNEGIVSKNELLTTRVQLNEIELHILQAEKTVEIAKLNVKKLAQLPVQKNIEILDSILIESNLPDTTNIVQEAMNRRPELRMLEQQVLAGEQMEKIVGAKYAPSFGVSVGGNYSNGIVETPEGGFHYNVLATASMPIVKWGKKKSEKLVQQYNTQSAREILNEQKLGIQFDIAKAYYSLDQSIKQVSLARQAAEEARENLRVYIDRYDEGLSSIVEVTEAQTFLQNALISLFSYRTNYQFSVVEYNRALGLLNDAN